MASVHDFGRRKFPRAELLFSSARRNWSGMAAEIRNHPAGEIPPPVPQQMEITLALRGAEGARVQRRAGGELQDTAVRRGTVWLCPIGVVEDSIRITDDLQDVLHIYIGREVFADMSRDLSRPVAPEEIAYRADVDDDFLRQVGFRVQAELEQESSAGRLLVDSLTRALAAHLVSLYAGERRPPLGDVSLDRNRLRRVIDYINDNIESELLLAELSDIACLSVHHFARAFRSAMGVPPHRFISSLRVERAQDLLLHSDLSLAEIAHACRFSSQSTFTRAFRRHVGISPGEFRRGAK
ncbi:AraC family transcriptional regulator [Ancylobacter polymorphus]|uniref:AraC family transcriptional regulator n=1 Tax=Ancylobacter polymorphus TaxID=223390 RepID=A0A9E7D5A6_9HYPH|nr:AraC family transcriptional regulator [Ancylobacter polymorphus]UOK69396.1 AraC family transcriptional regulator [Ancylobacter polymorphus]